MFSPSDTIVAIATPPGRGGIGVVRVSGPTARGVAGAMLSIREPLGPRHATFTHVRGTAPAAVATNEGGAADAASGVGHRDQPAFIDQVVATYFQAPASYTGEDVVEISAHGSPVVLGQILSAAMQAGARLAEPGEFTLRAFLNGRLDLVQAEAVADLIDAVTPLQARAAYDQLEGTLTREIADIDAALFDLAARFEASVDFPDEGYHFVEPGAAAAEIGAIAHRVASLLANGRGRVIREGATIALAGKPNVGKSSLFNALVGTSRAIVTATPGTTRDFITELTDIEGLRITLVDTAGDRAPQDDIDEVECAGLERARGARSVAELVLVVLDRSQPLDDIDRAILRETADRRRLVVVNKCDLHEAWSIDALGHHRPLAISARTQEGLDRLRCSIVHELGGCVGGVPAAALAVAWPAALACLGAGGEALRDPVAVTNIRHIELLERAHGALDRAGEALERSHGTLSEEFVLADLQDARNALEEITGKRTADDLLEHIFGRFCIGK
jgi:tRNA modification GTPase